MARILFLFGLVTLIAVVQSLDLESVQEGACSEVKPATNLDQRWFRETTFPYISGGNKYHLYRFASSLPRFAKTREFEFYYNACYQTYFNVTAGTGAVYGFGDGVIGNYLIRPVEENILDFIQLPTPGLADTSRHVITLTDNKSFVVYSNCWQGSNQRGWDVITTVPHLNEKTKQLIEDHVVSQGFNRENNVFLDYSSCNSPVPGSIGMDKRGRYNSRAGLYEKRLRNGH